MYNAYGALANSPAGMNLLPNGSQGMFQNGGYQMGGLGNNMSRMLQTYLGQLNSSQQPTPADVSRAEQGTNNGPGTVGAQSPGGGGAGGGNNPTPSSQSGLPEGRSAVGPGPTIPGVSGINDIARQIPGIGALVSSFENNTGDLLGRSDTSGNNVVGGGVPVLSGVNDMARAVLPGLGGLEDITGGLMNAATGRNPNVTQTPGGGSGAGAVTVNPSGSPAPRSLGLLLQRMGLNSVPQGVDPNSFVDNALYQILGGRQ
jgi:hypothetical protein